VKTVSLQMAAGLACCAIAQSAFSAPTVVLKQLPFNPSLSEYCSGTVPTVNPPDTLNGENLYWIGNNPSAVALYGDKLIVGGWNNSGATGPIGATAIVSDYSNPVAPGTFYPRGNFFMGDALKLTWPNARSYTGFRMTAETPAAGGNLALAADGGGAGPATQIVVYDATTQVNPILVASSPADNVRGNAGAAWDAGFDGTGFGAGDPIAVSLVPFNAQGPWGLRPATVDRFDNIYGPGLNGTPPGFDIIPNTTDSLHRSLDIDRDLIVNRAGNGLRITKRNGSNTAATTTTILPANLPFSSGQNIALLIGANGASGSYKRVMVYNDIEAADAGFENVVKFRDEDGALVNVSVQNFDGSPFSLPAGSTPNGQEITPIGTFWSFGWDPFKKRLAMVNFSNRAVLVFAATTDCPADLNHDGVVEDADFVLFASQYDALIQADGPFAGADLNGDAYVDDSDFVEFVSAYNTLLCPGTE